MATKHARGTVLLPRAEAFKGRATGRVATPGLADLRGKTVAFIDDSRPNANVVLAAYQELLESKYGIHAVVVRKNEHGLRVNESLSKELFADLVGRVDAGVVALGS